jgi:hypothetical protein
MQVKVDLAERLLAAFSEYDKHEAARLAFQEELKAGGITAQRQSELLNTIAALSTVMVGAGTVSRLWLRTVGGGPRGVAVSRFAHFHCWEGGSCRYPERMAAVWTRFCWPGACRCSAASRM